MNPHHPLTPRRAKPCRLPNTSRLARAVALTLGAMAASGGAWAFDYTVPPNLTSTLYLTGTDTLTVTSGSSIITAGNAVYLNGGTGNTIDNAGSISASDFGIYNLSTLTNLTNSGTISSDIYGIQNDGTLTTLTNTGAISSGIRSFGTLTTLTNAQNNLTYSGALPGSYYTYFTNASTYGTVSFGNTSPTLSNYGLQIAPGQNYAVGTYSGVMTSADPLTVSATEAVYGVTYHLYTADNLTWDLIIDSVVSARVTDAATARGNMAALGAAAVIDATPGLLSLFAPLTTETQLSAAASQTLPLLAGGSTLAAFSTLAGINQVIQARQEANLGLASGDAFYGDRRVWMKPFGSWARQDDRSGVSGFDANTWGMVLGADATLSATARLGAAFAYAKSNVNSNSAVAPQGNDVDIYHLIGYGSHSLDADTELNFQVDAGMNQNSGRRVIAFAGSVADSSYDSHAAHAGLSLRRSYALSEKTRITPSVRADYTWIRDESYSETGAGALNLNIDSHSAQQLVLAVGGKLSHALESQTRLDAYLGAGYDLINDQALITAAFAGSPGASFVTYGIDPSPWIGRAGLGLVHTLQGGMEISARYDAEARKDFSNQTASVKARWTF